MDGTEDASRKRGEVIRSKGDWVGEGPDAVLSTSAFAQCAVGSPRGL